MPPTHEVADRREHVLELRARHRALARDCGCNSGGEPGWNQQWRKPLRDALDWLRDQIVAALRGASAGCCFAIRGRRAMRTSTSSSTARRDHASGSSRSTAAHADSIAEQRHARWKLMELQRHAMLMYTSCGWFFDELSGIETVQVHAVRRPRRAACRRTFPDAVEAPFLERLAAAKSNLPEYGDGANIYRRYVKPSHRRS